MATAELTCLYNFYSDWLH